MTKATLIVQIPPERFRSFDGSVPKIGDIICLDQGFTFPNGNAGCLVYCAGENGTFKWEAELYEFEIGDNL